MARNGRTLVFEVVEGVRRGAMVDEGVVEQMRHDCASQLTVEGGVGSEARLLECGPQDIAVLFGNRGESWDFGRVVEDIDRGVETQLFEPGLDFGYEGVAGALAAGALAVLFAEHDSHEIEVASGVLWQDDGEDSVHVLIYPKTDNLSSVFCDGNLQLVGFLWPISLAIPARISSTVSRPMMASMKMQVVKTAIRRPRQVNRLLAMPGRVGNRCTNLARSWWRCRKTLPAR